MVIPDCAQKYFWDSDISKLDMSQYSHYIIERLLELGDEQAVAWMTKNFSQSEISKVIRTSRRLSPRSRNFWQLIISQ